MSQCLNPNCVAKNPDHSKLCQKCGSKLLLKDRYRAIKIIGQGGFGKTFLAVDEDKPSHPYCVIKQFLPQAQGTGDLAKASELFEQEAIRLDQLGKHPQIPELLAYFIHEDNRQYLVQEYIEGENLQQELKGKSILKESEIRDLLREILCILHFVHDAKVIHRDIKPENIIRRKQDNQLFLVDFGSAKLLTPTNRSMTGTVIGSAEYVAPEQSNGKAIYASDLYSLGVTCIHLLTGISPFDLFSDSDHDWVWRQYLVDNPVSDQLGNVLDKLITLATGKRYGNTTEVLQDLQVPIPSAVTTNQLTAKEFFDRAYNKSNLGDYQGAIADYTQAIQLKPDYADAYNNRGIAKSNLGDYQGAIADYQEAARLYQEQGKMKDYQDTLNRIKGLQK